MSCHVTSAMNCPNGTLIQKMSSLLAVTDQVAHPLLGTGVTLSRHVKVCLYDVQYSLENHIIKTTSDFTFGMFYLP